MKDYSVLFVGLTPIWAGALAVMANNLVVGTFLATMAIASSFGCVPLLAYMWLHGIHNDR